MKNLNVIAKPYAKAAFEFANENDLLQSWSTWLQVFAQLVKDGSLNNILSNPTLSEVEVINTFKDQLDERFFNFIILLAKNNKLLVLPEILDQFEDIKSSYNRTKLADVTLAYAADDILLTKLKTNLEKRFKCCIDINVNINPKIIGGVIIKVDDTVIDYSVPRHLEKLKSILLS